MRQKFPSTVWLLLCSLMMGWNSHAAASPAQELQLFHRYSSLNSTSPDWSDWQLLWQKQQDSDNTLYLELNDIYHFGIHDQQLALGYQFKSRSSLQYQTEITTSTVYSLYPRYSLYAGIDTKLNNSLLLNTGLRYSHFDKSNSTATSLKLTSRFEYYSGNQLYSYSLYFTNMQGLALSDNATSHNLKYAYIYDDKNNVYLAFALGEELDFDPANAALSISVTHAISLGGMHWINQTLAIVYTVAKHDISSTNFGYQRNELYIGIRKLY